MSRREEGGDGSGDERHDAEACVCVRAGNEFVCVFPVPQVSCEICTTGAEAKFNLLRF